MRWARSASSQARAATKSASVDDSLATSAWRVGAGRSSRPNSASRIAARWPKRSTMRSIENSAMSASGFSISSRQASARADLGDRGRDRALQRRAAGDRGLHGRPAGRDQVDQVGVDEQRRALEHRHRDVGLVGGERWITAGGAFWLDASTSRERRAHQRRRIVEQHDHRAFGGGAIVGAKIGDRDRRAPARWLPRPVRRQARYGPNGGTDEQS